MSFRLFRSVWISALLTVPLVLGSQPALAWGPDGHWIIGKIAEDHLVPIAARRVQLLLGRDASLAEAGNWADQVREEREETAPWHYINIPPGAMDLDLERDCAKGDCITTQIRRFTGIVRLGVRSPEERQEALKFLVHLIGDLHQPLHAGYGQDRGGNDTEVVFEGEHLNLHAFWDTAVLRAMIETEDRAALAARLSRSLSSEQQKQWAKGTISDWTWESHLLAVRVAYGALPSGNPKQLNQAYADQASHLAEEQLKKAGARLAALINSIWGH